jgi:hypothetical protein
VDGGVCSQGEEEPEDGVQDAPDSMEAVEGLRQGGVVVDQVDSSGRVAGDEDDDDDIFFFFIFAVGPRVLSSSSSSILARVASTWQMRPRMSRLGRCRGGHGI